MRPQGPRQPRDWTPSRIGAEDRSHVGWICTNTMTITIEFSTLPLQGPNAHQWTFEEVENRTMNAINSGRYLLSLQAREPRISSAELRSFSEAGYLTYHHTTSVSEEFPPQPSAPAPSHPPPPIGSPFPMAPAPALTWRDVVDVEAPSQSALAPLGGAAVASMGMQAPRPPPNPRGPLGSGSGGDGHSSSSLPLVEFTLSVVGPDANVTNTTLIEVLYSQLVNLLDDTAVHVYVSFNNTALTSIMQGPPIIPLSGSRAGRGLLAWGEAREAGGRQLSGEDKSPWGRKGGPKLGLGGPHRALRRQHQMKHRRNAPVEESRDSSAWSSGLWPSWLGGSAGIAVPNVAANDTTRELYTKWQEGLVERTSGRCTEREGQSMEGVGCSRRRRTLLQNGDVPLVRDKSTPSPSDGGPQAPPAPLGMGGSAVLMGLTVQPNLEAQERAEDAADAVSNGPIPVLIIKFKIENVNAQGAALIEQQLKYILEVRNSLLRLVNDAGFNIYSINLLPGFMPNTAGPMGLMRPPGMAPTGAFEGHPAEQPGMAPFIPIQGPPLAEAVAPPNGGLSRKAVVAITLSPAIAAVVMVLAVGFLVWRRKHYSRKDAQRLVSDSAGSLGEGGKSSGFSVDSVVAGLSANHHEKSVQEKLLSLSRVSLPRLPGLRSDWELDPSQLQILRRPDGSEWELGRGAYGRVYKALYNGVQTVAVKVFTDQLSEGQAEDFRREVTILRACRDRNVVAFVGASLVTGQAIMATEFMDNGDLYHAIADDQVGRFGWYRVRGPNGNPVPGTGLARRIALDVARGLCFLHSKNIAHLDLKSANVLLARDWSAKVADVGLAKICKDSYLSSFKAVGTFAWAAPEMLLGRPCSPSVDIYSLGVLLWELAAGESPHSRCLRDLRVPEECPEAVGRLMRRCLSEDPLKRPSAREVVKELEQLGPELSGGRTPPGSQGSQGLGMPGHEIYPSPGGDAANGATAPTAPIPATSAPSTAQRQVLTMRDSASDPPTSHSKASTAGSASQTPSVSQAQGQGDDSAGAATAQAIPSQPSPSQQAQPAMGSTQPRRPVRRPWGVSPFAAQQQQEATPPPVSRRPVDTGVREGRADQQRAGEAGGLSSRPSLAGDAVASPPGGPRPRRNALGYNLVSAFSSAASRVAEAIMPSTAPAPTPGIVTRGGEPGTSGERSRPSEADHRQRTGGDRTPSEEPEASAREGQRTGEAGSVSSGGPATLDTGQGLPRVQESGEPPTPAGEGVAESSPLPAVEEPPRATTRQEKGPDGGVTLGKPLGERDSTSKRSDHSQAERLGLRLGGSLSTKENNLRKINSF